MTAVSLDEVCKAYSEGTGQRQVLDRLSLHIDPGETVALLGASGSGKSTLLNLISGLLTPDSGKVTVDGSVLSDLGSEDRTRFRRSRIGFVFQFFHLIPTLTVRENILLSLQLNGMDDSAGLKRVEDLLQRVGLEDRGETFPDRLSGGEQQRVAVCRALAHRPPVILADEPTGNLDAGTAEDVLSLVLELAEEEKATLIIVTHSNDVAARCGRVVQLS